MKEVLNDGLSEPAILNAISKILLISTHLSFHRFIPIKIQRKSHRQPIGYGCIAESGHKKRSFSEKLPYLLTIRFAIAIP